MPFRFGKRRRTLRSRHDHSLSLLLDGVPDHALYALDSRGRVQSWNKAAETLFGFAPADIIGCHHSRLYTGPATALTFRLLTQARQTGSSHYEGLLHAKGKKPFWAIIDITATPPATTPATGLSFLCMVHDATLARQEQDHIAFQASLLNRVRNAILATDTHGRIVYMNSYAETLFQLPWALAEGRYLEELGLWPDDLCALPPRQDGRERFEREVTARRADGSTFPALCTTSVSPAPYGMGYSEAHVIHDLSDLKAMQAALQHGANLAVLGRMSASLVHEISQPMNVIRLTAEGNLLKLGKTAQPETLLDDFARSFQTIADQAARLFETVEFMQTFSRQSEGQIPLPAAPVDRCFDLARSLREAASVLYLGFQRADVTLTLTIPDQPCLAHGHARHIEQVLINLLNNALYAVSHHQGQHGEVQASLRLQDDRWQLRICDNGPGIAPAIASRIFEPFFTTKPTGQGSGLGLAISLEIIRDAGGSLEYVPSPTGGACFSITLPQAHGASLSSAPPPATPSGMTQAGLAQVSAKGHVLIVDDDQPTRLSLAQALGTLGYQVSEASGGHAALAQLEQGAAFDVVITDLRMPDGNGFELLERMAEDYPHVFTVVITGQARRDREAFAALEGNCDVLLPKPLALRTLEKALRDLLEQ
ncbi:ATP-binding protein [Insolitispirillum peregrinum]|uniref:ATP-binding protein n=1 Tax=Insolitispirillum peregrinum TaxID=80876 RepID=UPI00361FAC42